MTNIVRQVNYLNIFIVRCVDKTKIKFDVNLISRFMVILSICKVAFSKRTVITISFNIRRTSSCHISKPKTLSLTKLNKTRAILINLKNCSEQIEF